MNETQVKPLVVKSLEFTMRYSVFTHLILHNENLKRGGSLNANVKAP